MSQIDPTERFAEMIGAAFDRAHRRTAGTDLPGASVWTRINAGMSGTRMRSDAADPSALALDQTSAPSLVMETRRIGMDMTMSAPVPANSRSRSYWWTALVAGVAMLVVLATIRMTLPPTGPVNEGRNIAMAPMVSTPESTPQVSSRTPRESTPKASVCIAEPLTADEVMDIVKSPSLGYARLNYDPVAPTPTISADASSMPSLDEWPNPSAIKDLSEEAMPRDAEASIPVVEAKEAADQFWNCLLYGTSYQVWGLMAPELVQMEILSYHQVFRSESDVVTTIQKVGPKPYFENGNKAFSAREALQGQSIEISTLPGDEGIWTVETDPAQEARVVIVQMDAVDPGENLNLPPRHYLLQKFENGQWIVLGVDWQSVSP